MKPQHAENILREYAREQRLSITPSELSNVAFVLEGYDVEQTGLRSHQVIGLAGDPEIVTRYGQKYTLTLADLLEELTAGFARESRA